MQKSIYSEHYGLLLATLRNARTAGGLSQAQIAEKLGLTQSTVGKCERGERRLDVVELRNWCGAIGLTLYDLVREFEDAISRFEALKRTGAQKAVRKTVSKTAGKAARKTAQKALRKEPSEDGGLA
ncbi:helix-turn-helix domain-containing protein [Paraburkholderia sp. MM6662-R1]|uniref:helix-turn-helix domain-containing protein n=1 Tax=Paraburkholderia sp. MM6662-R1 TaxID=2991066 RepID=UPI003D1BA117